MNRTFAPSIILNISLVPLGALRLAAQEDPSPRVRVQSATGIEDQAKSLYAPYEFLIGEWDVKSEDDGPVAAVVRVR
jgi:hypothetical protein